MRSHRRRLLVCFCAFAVAVLAAAVGWLGLAWHVFTGEAAENDCREGLPGQFRLHQSRVLVMFPAGAVTGQESTGDCDSLFIASTTASLASSWGRAEAEEVLRSHGAKAIRAPSVQASLWEVGQVRVRVRDATARGAATTLEIESDVPHSFTFG